MTESVPYAPLYLVQCATGDLFHIYSAVRGSELEAECKRRAEANPKAMSAFMLGPDDCPGCVEERRERRRYDDMLTDLGGCPLADLNGDCDDNCEICGKRPEIADSPYADQVVGCPVLLIVVE